MSRKELVELSAKLKSLEKEINRAVIKKHVRVIERQTPKADRMFLVLIENLNEYIAENGDSKSANRFALSLL